MSASKMAPIKILTVIIIFIKLWAVIVHLVLKSLKLSKLARNVSSVFLMQFAFLMT